MRKISVFLMIIFIFSSCGSGVSLYGDPRVDEVEDFDDVYRSSISTYCCPYTASSSFACSDGAIRITLAAGNQTQLLTTDGLSQSCTSAEDFIIDDMGRLAPVSGMMDERLLDARGFAMMIPPDAQRIRVNYRGELLVSYTNEGSADFEKVGELVTGICACEEGQMGETVCSVENVAILDTFLFCDQRFNLFIDDTNSDYKLNIEVKGRGLITLYDDNTGEHFYTSSSLFYIDPYTESFYVETPGAIREKNSKLMLSPEIIVPPEGLDSLRIEPDGRFTVNIDGDVVEIGQLFLATFANPSGLARSAASNSVYVETAHSGAAMISHPGEMGAGEIDDSFRDVNFVTVENTGDFEKARLKLSPPQGSWFRLRETMNRIINTEVMLQSEPILYTKNQNFVVRSDGVIASAISEVPLLGIDNRPITLPRDADILSLNLSSNGALSVERDGIPVSVGRVSAVSFDDEIGLAISDLDPSIYAWEETLDENLNKIEPVLSEVTGATLVHVLKRDTSPECIEQQAWFSDASLTNIEILNSKGEVCGFLTPRFSMSARERDQALHLLSLRNYERDLVPEGFDGSRYYNVNIAACSCVNHELGADPKDIDCGYSVLVSASNQEAKISIDHISDVISGVPVGEFEDPTVCRNDPMDMECREFGSFWPDYGSSSMGSSRIIDADFAGGGDSGLSSLSSGLRINSNLRPGRLMNIRVEAPNGNIENYYLDTSFRQQMMMDAPL